MNISVCLAQCFFPQLKHEINTFHSTSEEPGGQGFSGKVMLEMIGVGKENDKPLWTEVLASFFVIKIYFKFQGYIYQN